MTDQNEDRHALQARLVGLLKFPGESPSTDYKEAKAFSPKDDFGIKLVKHILGMANSGGGHLVIGYSERNEKLEPDPAMNDGVTASYDSTSLSQTIGSFVRGEEKPTVVVEKVPYDGQHYPIVCVQEFSRNPFFCRSTVDGADEKPILRQGALYVRDQHTRTVEVASPAQWEQLISRCVRKRQSEMLDAFGRVLSELRSGERREETTYIKDFETVVARERVSARQRLAQENVPVAGWYCWHAPVDPHGPFNPKQLRDAAERAVRHSTGLPIGLTCIGDNRVAADQDGLRMQYAFRDISPQLLFFFEDWFLHERGGFFLYRSHDGAGQSPPYVSWTRRIWDIAEALDHCLALYEALDVDMQTEMHFSLTHEGLMDVPLICTDPHRMWIRDDVCKIEQVNSSWNGTLATLQARRKELTLKLCQELFIRFDFCDLSDGVIAEVYDKYAKSRVG